LERPLPLFGGLTLRTRSMRYDYATPLREIALQPMIAGTPNAVDKVIDLLDAYGMSRDDLFETLQELQFPDEWKVFAFYLFLSLPKEKRTHHLKQIGHIKPTLLSQFVQSYSDGAKSSFLFFKRHEQEMLTSTKHKVGFYSRVQ